MAVPMTSGGRRGVRPKRGLAAHALCQRPTVHSWAGHRLLPAASRVVRPTPQWTVTWKAAPATDLEPMPQGGTTGPWTLHEGRLTTCDLVHSSGSPRPTSGLGCLARTQVSARRSELHHEPPRDHERDGQGFPEHLERSHQNEPGARER